MTLLDIVQDILSDMDSDEVNSINDTIESQQVVGIVKNTFYEVINSRLWPTHTELAQLTASGDADLPTKMTFDTSVSKIEWIKYNVKTAAGDKEQFSERTYKEPEDFLEIVLSRDSTASTVDTMSVGNNIDIFVRNDIAPSYWTSFDDSIIYFDAYNSDLEATLQASKTIVNISKEPAWTETDVAVPDLPAKAFPYFLAEAKSSCFEKLKQAPSQKEEQKSRRQRTFLAREKWRTNGGIQYPSYGRK